MNTPRIALASMSLLLAAVTTATRAQQFTAWSSPVNLGPTINGPLQEFGPFVSKDGLSLYFGAFGRPGGFGGVDLYVSRRAGADDPWGEPENLGFPINTPANEQAPTLSIDGHRLYFHSDRTGDPWSHQGGQDLYVARRRDARDDLGWRMPQNLGPPVNTPGDEVQPAVFEDGATGAVTLLFSRSAVGGGGTDIYQGTRQADETFGAVAPVTELNTSFIERQPTVRKDGLELFLASNRPGTLGALDIWVSTRSGTAEPWSTPENLGPVVNGADVDARGSLSFDGTVMYLQSIRPDGFGSFDVYTSTRTKVKGPGEDD